jgi:hypothetical protein
MITELLDLVALQRFHENRQKHNAIQSVFFFFAKPIQSVFETVLFLVLFALVKMVFLLDPQVLVALQGALTVIGNITMCIAAYHIFKASQEGSKTS